MGLTDLLIHITEIIGTIAFSISGAITAIGKKLDLLGVIVLGGVTALGGGAIRDILLGQTPPLAFYNFEYLIIAGVTALLVFIAAAIFKKSYIDHLKLFEAINNIFDAVGLGAFSVVGVQIAFQSGYGSNPFFCIFLGVMTGCGGGILRDIMCAKIPYVLTKHIYALASAAGSALYWLLIELELHRIVAVGVGMMSVVAIRMLATIFRWSLPKLSSLAEPDKTS